MLDTNRDYIYVFKEPYKRFLTNGVFNANELNKPYAFDSFRNTKEQLKKYFVEKGDFDKNYALNEIKKHRNKLFGFVLPVYFDKDYNPFSDPVYDNELFLYYNFYKPYQDGVFFYEGHKKFEKKLIYYHGGFISEPVNFEEQSSEAKKYTLFEKYNTKEARNNFYSENQFTFMQRAYNRAYKNTFFIDNRPTRLICNFDSFFVKDLQNNPVNGKDPIFNIIRYLNNEQTPEFSFFNIGENDRLRIKLDPFLRITIDVFNQVIHFYRLVWDGQPVTDENKDKLYYEYDFGLFCTNKHHFEFFHNLLIDFLSNRNLRDPQDIIFMYPVRYYNYGNVKSMPSKGDLSMYIFETNVNDLEKGYIKKNYFVSDRLKALGIDDFFPDLRPEFQVPEKYRYNELYPDENLDYRELSDEEKEGAYHLSKYLNL